MGRQRCWRQVAEEPDTKGHPCMHSTIFQRARCDSVKGNRRRKNGASCAHCHGCQSAGFDNWRASFLSVPNRVSPTLECPLYFRSLTFVFDTSMCGNVSLLFAKTPSSISALAFTYPVWRRSGLESGAANRQVFRCVMSDMLTQHEIITGRRQVWQQCLPDHDYIISFEHCWRSWERPTCTTKHPWDLDAKAKKINTTNM